MNNGVVNVVSTIIQHVMALASEAKLVALYINVKYGVVINNTL